MAKPTILPPVKIIEEIKSYDLDGKVCETYEICERTFFAKNLRLDSAERKRVNKNFLHSNTLEEYKYALRIKSTGGTLGYRTIKEARSAAINLSTPEPKREPMTKEHKYFAMALLSQVLSK